MAYITSLKKAFFSLVLMLFLFSLKLTYAVDLIELDF